MKSDIVLVGPVYPYKGGISHYTSLLYRALEKKYKVTMVSYSMQYPRILYHHEQKDEQDDTLKIEGTEYLINTANPFNWRKAAKAICDMSPELIIIEWWHPYFSPCYQGIVRKIKKLRRKEGKLRRHAKELVTSSNQNGIKSLFLCHNVFPHEHFPLDRRLTRDTLKLGDYYIVQSGRDAEDLKSLFPDARYAQTVHPTYDVFHFGNYDRKSAREALEITERQKVLLFFGFVREYKGLRYLLEAMPKILQEGDSHHQEIGPQERTSEEENIEKEKQIEQPNYSAAGESYQQNILSGQAEGSDPGKSDVVLLIAGDFGSEENKKSYMDLIDQLGIRDAVRIEDGYIPDQEIEKYFLASDVCMCPYTDATQSGIVQIAYGFDLPVIATRVGGLPDVVEDGKTGYLVDKESPKQLADAVVRYFTRNDREKMEKNIRKEAYRFSWDRMREVIEELTGIG